MYWFCSNFKLKSCFDGCGAWNDLKHKCACWICLWWLIYSSVYIYIYLFIHTCTYSYMYIFIYVHSLIYIYIHTYVYMLYFIVYDYIHHHIPDHVVIYHIICYQLLSYSIIYSFIYIIWLPCSIVRPGALCHSQNSTDAGLHGEQCPGWTARRLAAGIFGWNVQFWMV